MIFAYRQFILGRYNRQLLNLASTDPLTQLPNRIKIDEKLAECHSRYQRNQNPYSLIIVDIDWFKRVNDTYGHLIGDQTLVSVARLLRNSVRQIDTVGRWGGEEFIIVCPDTDLEGAHQVALKIQAAVNAYDFKPVGALSVSAGVVQCRENDRMESVVGRADDALYIAKEHGRNAVILN